MNIKLQKMGENCIIFRKIITKHFEKHCSSVCERSELEIFVIFFGKNHYFGHFKGEIVI